MPLSSIFLYKSLIFLKVKSKINSTKLLKVILYFRRITQYLI